MEAKAIIKAKSAIKLVPFDAARYLTDDAAVAEYMTAILKADDAHLLLLTLRDVARAQVSVFQLTRYSALVNSLTG